MDITPLQIVSVIITVRARDKFLLVQRGLEDKILPGKWQNPGGKVRLGETVEEALRRELKEETGITIEEPPVFLQSYSWKKDNNDPLRLGLIFLTNLRKAPAEYVVKINQELMNHGWFILEEAKDLDLIGKDSPTGTFGQLLQAEKFLREGKRKM